MLSCFIFIIMSCVYKIIVPILFALVIINKPPVELQIIFATSHPHKAITIQNVWALRRWYRCIYNIYEFIKHKFTIWTRFNHLLFVFNIIHHTYHIVCIDLMKLPMLISLSFKARAHVRRVSKVCLLRNEIVIATVWNWFKARFYLCSTSVLSCKNITQYYNYELDHKINIITL